MSATIDEVNKPLAEAIIAHLRQISGDASLTLQRIEVGSVKLVLEGSQEGMEKILALFREGKLTEILGIPVQNVQVVAFSKQETATPQLRALTTNSEQKETIVEVEYAGSKRQGIATLRLSFEEGNLTMTKDVKKLALDWQKRLAVECPDQNEATRQSIILWLLGSDSKRFDLFDPKEIDIAKQAMEYRWRILRQRYLGLGRERAYRNLITRLGSLVTLRNKIQTWVSLSRDRQRSVMDVLQELIQQLLQSDSQIQQQMVDIAKYTTDRRLRDALLFASVEEYCLRPVRNQPLLAYRFVNYLRRTQHGGLTQVPGHDLVRLVSEEVLTGDNDNRVNLVDSQAIGEHQEAQQLEEQLALHQSVQKEFENYLQENLGTDAVEWLRMYLQGKTQEEIARRLNKPTKEVYRLREKISYHAVRIFALKGKPELVDSWLSISLQEHNLGLTQNQWQQLDEKLTPLGRQILDLRKAGDSIEAIAEQLKLKTHQVLGEWTKVYLTAQALRSQE